MRVLQLGPLNTIHFEHQVAALHERGVEVIAAGEFWPGLPAPDLPVEAVVKDGAFVPWLRSLRRRVRPDVVHAHWLPFAAKALAAGARPLVAQPWGSDVYRATPLFRAANAVVARLADRCVADSADLLEQLGARRSLILNWGVDLQTFTPGAQADARAALGLGPGPLVLSPRGLKPLYNPLTIVAAFERVRERVPDVELALKHPGEKAPDLGPLPDGVRMVGAVAYERMADWYRAASVCVSIPETDSSPRSVWEAMACGAPCVVSDLPWARKELRAGENALLVPAEAGPVAGALERVLGDGELAARLGANARSLVERTQDRERETDRLIALYDELASR